MYTKVFLLFSIFTAVFAADTSDPDTDLTGFEDLPFEVQKNIISRLSVKKLAKLKQTCTKAASIISEYCLAPSDEFIEKQANFISEPFLIELMFGSGDISNLKKILGDGWRNVTELLNLNEDVKASLAKVVMENLWKDPRFIKIQASLDYPPELKIEDMYQAALGTVKYWKYHYPDDQNIIHNKLMNLYFAYKLNSIGASPEDKTATNKGLKKIEEVAKSEGIKLL